MPKTYLVNDKTPFDNDITHLVNDYHDLVNGKHHLVSDKPHLANDYHDLVDDKTPLVNDYTHLVNDKPDLANDSTPFGRVCRRRGRAAGLLYFEFTFSMIRPLLRLLGRPAALLAAAVLLTACPDKKPAATETEAPAETPLRPAPAFNADSAYAYIAKQVSFGPRVPNTPAHQRCGDWLVSEFRRRGLTVQEQPFTAMAFDGTMLRGRNIIARFAPQAARRVALFAHWDTRPFADKDKQQPNAALDGAIDGASGVAVLLEMARQLAAQPDSLTPKVGVDFILFDAEDYGYDSSTQADKANQLAGQGVESWCLGSQHWAKNLVPPGYKPEYGILLDMVGAKGARFSREQLSREKAGDVVGKIWNVAYRLGYSDYFIAQDIGSITDDHVFTNQAGVRTVDIIDHVPYGDEFFPPYHHTVQDNMSMVDRNTLKAVGQTVLTTLYQE
ncbi:M28 family peptidase [Hymenobacter sp. B81]|uniref:M28 family peptidase n=1 Tax=Hymenobacter sp. B81 TaxID=3344878 RepID=UPI0037DCA5D4